MPNPQTNLRLDPAIRNKAIAAAKAQGIALATLVERALVAYLDGGCSLLRALSSRILSVDVTIAGTPGVDDWLYFEVFRDVADTLTADARLIGIKLQYTETTTEPTAW